MPLLGMRPVDIDDAISKSNHHEFERREATLDIFLLKIQEEVERNYGSS